MASTANAGINPWIAADIYDPQKWDTAGPQTATPWLHPPTWSPGQDWGVLSGRLNDSTAISGSWGGVRDDLRKKGIAIISSYFGQPAFNPVGGIKEGESSWLSNVNLGVYLDLQRLISWSGGFFLADLDWRTGGRGLTAEAIGNQFPVQLANGDNATRLVHLAFGQELFDNTVELAAGRIITGEDFATIRLACTSLNQAICANPIAANQSISFPIYPFGVWGARLKAKPGMSWYSQVGAYAVYPDFRNPDDHGVRFSLPDAAGILALGEIGYVVGHYRGDNGLPGKYKIGGYVDGERLSNLKTGQPERGTWGIYGLAEQMIYSEDTSYTQGFSAWLALSYAPPDLNLIEFMAAGGLSYAGLIPGRTKDALSFICSYGRYSRDLRSRQQATGEPIQSAEVLLELNYRIQMTSWLFLQPDVQVIPACCLPCSCSGSVSPSAASWRRRSLPALPRHAPGG